MQNLPGGVRLPQAGQTTSRAAGATLAQLRRMLVYEGLLYTLGALLLSLVLVMLGGPLMSSALSSMYWFFTYRLILWPLAALLPIFLLLGVLLPLLSYRRAARSTVVERLRQE